MEPSARPASLSLLHSFSLKLVLLAIVLLSVPLILYWQFQRAERQQSQLLRNAVTQRGRIIAGMLTPHFVKFRQEMPGSLREAMQGAAVGDLHVKVLLRLGAAPVDAFIYIAAAPPVTSEYLNRERAELTRAGIFQRLASACAGSADLSVRYVNPAGRAEVLTSMTPVHIGADCWLVIISQNAAELAPVRLNLPFFLAPGMTVAAAVYVLGGVLVAWLMIQMWRNVSRFRRAARRIRFGGPGKVRFGDLNTIPELTRVAEDFDSLVAALVSSQTLIKQTAEENAHAFKAPMAVIAQSIEPLKRGAQDASAQRSVQLIERSLAKLDALVSSARDMEQAAADVVFPNRRPVNLSLLLAPMLADTRAALAAQNKRLDVRVESGVSAFANEDMIEAVVENLLENAASFTPEGGAIEIALERSGPVARLRIADSGPGVDPADLPHVFDRYFTRRPGESAAAGEGHHGLGLWIVKRNVEGLGGTVDAANRAPHGFAVTVTLRSDG